MYEDIANARFFRAKQSGISKFTEVDSVELSCARWVLADVDGELYQLVLAGECDVLSHQEVLDRIGESFAAGEPFGRGEMRVLSNPLIPQNPEIKSVGVEQSNTSVIFAGEDPAIAKFFRKLEPGINPDVELLEGLAKVGCDYVPELRGYSVVEHEGESYVTAMVQDFASATTEGWDLALRYAEQARSFASEAGFLGVSLRHVHQDLAAAFGTRSVPATEVVSGLEARLSTLIAQAPVLKEFEPAIRELYTHAAEGETVIQRIHGDAHLGQVLRTQERYLFIDFEGEPARPLAERRQSFSPLQDVAGIIRSFGYAAHFGNNLADPEGWAAQCSAAFLEGYGTSVTSLLEALVLDKALYEVVYEANNRPDWLHIPLDAVKRLVQ